MIDRLVNGFRLARGLEAFNNVLEKAPLDNPSLYWSSAKSKKNSSLLK